VQDSTMNFKMNAYYKGRKLRYFRSYLQIFLQNNLLQTHKRVKKLKQGKNTPFLLANKQILNNPDYRKNGFQLQNVKFCSDHVNTNQATGLPRGDF